MKVSLVIASLAGAVIVVFAGASFLFGEGMLSNGHHEWRISVEPGGDDSWSIIVPRLSAMEGPRAEVLHRLVSSLAVEAGSAEFTLDHMYVQMNGTGPATLVATRTFSATEPVGEREAFNDWMVPDMNATHLSGPPLLVSWAVDFSGGQGHTCWARAAFTATLAAGETQALRASSNEPAPPPGLMRPWAVACA